MAEALAQSADHRKRLLRLARAAKQAGLQQIWQLSDPDRLSAGAIAALGHLPVTGVIVRHYGLIAEISDGLSIPAKRLLSGPIPNALVLPGAFGVYWPSVHVRQHQRSHRMARAATMASAHNSAEIARALKHGIGTILISPAFASDSPSAAKPLTPVCLAILARRFPTADLIALGGIWSGNVRQLRRTKIKGVAGVSFGRPRRGV